MNWSQSFLFTSKIHTQIAVLNLRSSAALLDLSFSLTYTACLLTFLSNFQPWLKFLPIQFKASSATAHLEQDFEIHSELSAGTTIEKEVYPAVDEC